MIKQYNELIKPCQIETGRYYMCLVGDSYELCKIRLWSVYDHKTCVRVFNYAVTCYYTGKDLFVGNVIECQKWIAERLNYGKIRQ